MWRPTWNPELHKSSVYCAVQLSYNISSTIKSANSLRNCAQSVYKYILKKIDESIATVYLLHKCKLLGNTCLNRKNKCSNVQQRILFPGSYQVTENPFLESYLFSWNLVPEEASSQNIYNIPKWSAQALAHGRNIKTKLLKDINNCLSKSNPAFLKIVVGGMSSNEQAPANKKSKTCDGECTANLNDSDIMIVFEKLNSDEAMKNASASMSHSQTLQKTLNLSSGSNVCSPEVIVEEESRQCSFNLSKAARKRLHLNELRQWEYINFGQECNSDHSGQPDVNKHCFTVMSYNVLAQDLLENHPHLYYDHDPNALSWQFRSEGLLREIKEAAPDILCLQEVQESHLKSFYIPHLQELGYDGIYKKRTGDKPDGVAIYYKISVFSLEEHTSVEFMQPILPVLNRDNVALIARLSSRLAPSLPHLCIATTHLLYNPRRMDVKLAQIQLLLAEIERMAFVRKGPLSSYYPLIITGDLNVTPKSSVYRLLASGNLWDSDVADEMLDILGITDNCQHFSILNNRKKSENDSDDRISELRQLKVFNSDNTAASPKLNTSDDSHKESLESSQKRSRGHLSHNFILNSAYKHRNARGKEATTKQDQWVTVDYIFYSCSAREKNWEPIEGNLKLVARYGLLCKDECFSYGPIPNLASPSDHFPLICKFVLKP